MQVTVVGAGVIGLVSALALEERGHDVRVLALATDDAITSAVAGACWFPYRAGPPERVARWAAETRAWLTSLTAEPAAGVHAITGYEITDEPDDAAAPWWAAHIDVARVAAPVTGGPRAWRYGSLGIEPARFLPWLAAKLRHPIERRAIAEPASRGAGSAAEWQRGVFDDVPGDRVVHCTGLAARELAGDPALAPLLGQVVITEVGGVDRSVTITDERDPDAIFYVIPRRDELVLGGCSIPWHGPAGGPPPVEDPALTARIVAQAHALGLAPGPIKRVRVGLRPYRPEVRLARTGRVVHNYGHGGAGYTLCRGCADEVVALVEADA